METSPKGMSWNDADALARAAFAEHFGNRAVPPELALRLSWSSGKSISGWDFDVVLNDEIPPAIDPTTICIDDPRLPPGKVIVRIRVASESREVSIEECDGIPW